MASDSGRPGTSSKTLHRGFGRVTYVGAMPDRGRDLYLTLLDASWARLLGLAVAFYLASNLAFAGLYLLGSEPISGADGGLMDAFFFSVQTMSTIGYGAMSPQTPYGHTVATVESIFGLLSVAMATGLIFSKFARPSARLLFSKPAVICQWNGQPTLIFRVANIRGKELVQAAIKATVLKAERTPEGHSMRRIHDLKLVRSESPAFILSWQVMHVIDESSPLYGLTAEEMEEDGTVIIVTLTGLDAGYNQTVHARHQYYPDDLVRDHRLVDVIERLPDYSVRLNLGRFHDVEPEAGV